MIKMPATTAIIWRWDRGSMLWAAELPDGSILRARHVRRGSYNSRAFWRAEGSFPFPFYGNGTEWRSDIECANADTAESAAFTEWERRRRVIREKAVENVDRRHRYTMEYAPDATQHRLEYDEEECKLLGVEL